VLLLPELERTQNAIPDQRRRRHTVLPFGMSIAAAPRFVRAPRAQHGESEVGNGSWNHGFPLGGGRCCPLCSWQAAFELWLTRWLRQQAEGRPRSTVTFENATGADIVVRMRGGSVRYDHIRYLTLQSAKSKGRA